MKTISIYIAILLMISQVAFGQEQAGTETDTTKSDSVEVVITPKQGQDSTIVKVAGMKIIVLNERDGSGTEEIIIDTEDLGDEGEDDDDDNDKESKHVSHWAGIRVGVNGYLNNDNLRIPSTHEFLELDYARSVSVDLNFIEKDFNLYKQHVELVTGMGLHFANYTFKSQYATLSNTDPLSATIDSTYSLDRNKLRATYLTAPLMLGFSTHKKQSKALRFAAGGQVSWRIGSKLKQRYHIAGETYKPKVKSDFDLNPFLFHAVATIGYGPVNVFATYGLNTLFEDDKTLALTPFDVGLQLMF